MKNARKYFFFFLLVSACQNVEKPTKPENLIPEEKMIDVITDMMLTDAAINVNQVNSKIKNSNARRYIFGKYQIDSLQLAESTAYYLENYKRSKNIYEEVRQRLEKQKKEVDSLKAIEDSVRAAKNSLQVKKPEPSEKTVSVSDSLG